MHVSVQAVASNMVGTLRRPHEMGKGKDRLLGNKMQAVGNAGLL